jgi:Histidine kinase
MSKQGILLFLLIILLYRKGNCQPVPAEAIFMKQVNLPQHLQGIHVLSKPRFGKNGELYTYNDRYIINLNAAQPQPFAGSGLRGIPGKISGLYSGKESILWAFDDFRFYHFDENKQIFLPHTAVVNRDTILPHYWYAGCWNRYLLISAGKGYFYCLDTSGKPPFLKVKLPQMEGGPYRVFQMDDHQTMITTGRSWYVLQQNGKLKKILSFSTQEEAQSITLLPNEWLYVWGKSATLYAIHLPTLHVKKQSIGQSVVRPLGNFSFNGKHYALLAGTDSLYLFNPDATHYNTWKNSDRQQGHKIQASFGTVFQDPTGRVWIPNNKGMAYFNTPERITQPWFLYLNKLDTLAVSQVLEPKYIRASRFHPYVLFTASNQLHIVDTIRKGIIQTAFLPGRLGLSFTQLNELDNDRWLIGSKQGLFIFSMSNNGFEPIGYEGKALRNVKFAICNDSIIAVDTENNLLKASVHHPPKWVRQKFYPENIDYLEPFGENTLIALTSAGLFKHSAGGTWQTILAPAALSANQWSSSALGIHKANGYALLYTEGNLRIFNIQTGALKKHHKLTSPGVSFKADKIIEVDKSHIGLIYKNSPLTVVNIETGNYYNLGMQQGWWGEWMGAQADISEGSYNNWWATFDGGIIRYPVNWLLTPPGVPFEPTISNIRIQFEPHPFPSSFYRKKPLEVSYKKGAISLELYGEPLDSIEYCLLPFDAAWRKGSVATFTNLPGGTYTFKTRIAGASGSFSPERTMMIKVLPPFWKTTWFRVAVSLLLALAGYLLFRWRLHLQASRQNRNLQLAQSELKAIRSQMNPHFIFNCMTAIDGLIATGQNQKASVYLSKFSRLVRQVLQLSEKQLINLGDEINTLKLYLQLEQLRMQDTFDFTFDVTEGLEEEVEIPPMLLQPFVENAIIHGLKPSTKEEKHIRIIAGKQKGKLVFIIEDNGAGRNQSNKNGNTGIQHMSMGIKLTGDRLKMMEKVLPILTNYYYTDLFDENGYPDGTKVTIEITYQNDAA